MPTLTAPQFDGQELEAPSFSVAQYLHAPQLDGQQGRGATFQQDATTGTVVVKVNGTPVAWEHTFARQFQEQLSDEGSFTFQVLRSDFLADPVDFDDEIQIVIDGTPRFFGVVEGLDHVVLAPGEDAEQVVEIRGRSILGELDWHIIGPSRGVGELPIEDVRSMSWVSVDYSATAAGWPLAKVVNVQSSYADTDAPRPRVWPDRTGKWIWGNVPGVTALDAPQGICLFRQVFTLADITTCRFFMAGDNVMRLWIDGAEITWFAGSAIGRYAEIELSAGGHVIAAKVANKTDVPGEANPAGFILAGYKVKANGLLDESGPIVETNGEWRCLPYPVRAPGFTDGKAIRLFMDEAGLLGTWDLDFTDTKDSDGQPWTYQREIAVNVGRTILEYLRERSDFAVDFGLAPGGRILRMWNHGGRGIVRSTGLQQTDDPDTSDFLTLRHNGKRTRVTKFLGRYSDGHTEYEDAAAVAAHGERDGYLEIGHVFSEDEAQDILAALMATRSRPSFSTQATLKPRGDSTTPYRGFDVGDWIPCPNEEDDDESMRNVSVVWEEDEHGDVTWPVSLRDVAYEDEERTRVWLRRMADGVLVGGARVSSRKDTPSPTAQQISVLQVARFSMSGAVATGRWPKDPAAESGNIVQVVGELTTAGTTTTAVEVYRNSTLLTTLNFGSGDTEDVKRINIEPVRAGVDKLWIECTTAGSGAEDLVVQIQAI